MVLKACVHIRGIVQMIVSPFILIIKKNSPNKLGVFAQMIALIYIVPKKHSPNKEIAIKEKDVVVPAH